MTATITSSTEDDYTDEEKACRRSPLPLLFFLAHTATSLAVILGLLKLGGL